MVKRREEARRHKKRRGEEKQCEKGRNGVAAILCKPVDIQEEAPVKGCKRGTELWDVGALYTGGRLRRGINEGVRVRDGATGCKGERKDE